MLTVNANDQYNPGKTYAVYCVETRLVCDVHMNVISATAIMRTWENTSAATATPPAPTVVPDQGCDVTTLLQSQNVIMPVASMVEDVEQYLTQPGQPYAGATYTQST